MVSVVQLKVPQKAKSELRRAHANFAKKNNAAARTNVLKALEIYPNYSDAHAFLGIMNLTEQNLVAATEEVEEAIRLDSGSAMAYSALGAAYNALGRYEDALRALTSASRLIPHSWQVQFEMAKARLGKNDFSAAIRHANTAAELAPHQYSGIHLLKGYAFLALADHAQAITELQQYLSEQPESPDALAARRALDQAKTFFSNPE